MKDHRQIRFQLRESEMYLQFLREDMDSVGSINEDIAPRMEQLLQEVAERLRQLANLWDLQIKGERAKKTKKKANIP